MFEVEKGNENKNKIIEYNFKIIEE